MCSGPSYLRLMSCVPVSEAMAGLLAALEAWPVSDDTLDRLRRLPEWDDACAWGWVMESGELTGTGLAHVHELPDGLVPR